MWQQCLVGLCLSMGLLLLAQKKSCTWHEHGLRMKALGRQGLLVISFLVSGLAGLALHQVAFQHSLLLECCN